MTRTGRPDDCFCPSAGGLVNACTIPRPRIDANAERFSERLDNHLAVGDFPSEPRILSSPTRTTVAHAPASLCHLPPSPLCIRGLPITQSDHATRPTEWGNEPFMAPGLR